MRQLHLASLGNETFRFEKLASVRMSWKQEPWQLPFPGQSLRIFGKLHTPPVASRPDTKLKELGLHLFEVVKPN